MTDRPEKIVMEHTAPVAETPMILHTERADPKPDEPKPEPERQEQPERPSEVTVTTTVPVEPKPAEKPDKE